MFAFKNNVRLARQILVTTEENTELAIDALPTVLAR